MFKSDVIWNLQKGHGGFGLWQIKNNMNKTKKFEKLEFKTQNPNAYAQSCDKSNQLGSKMMEIGSFQLRIEMVNQSMEFGAQTL